MYNSFIVRKINNAGKGTLFSSFRTDICCLLSDRNKRRDDVVKDVLLKSVSKDFDCCKSADDLYMHTYVIKGGYELAILVLSDYLLDKKHCEEANTYKYEGIDEILFPFFVCVRTCS